MSLTAIEKHVLNEPVKKCRRCGGDHEVEFKELAQPIRPDHPGEFTHWASCPKSGEPILRGRMQESTGLPATFSGCHVDDDGRFRECSIEWNAEHHLFELR